MNAIERRKAEIAALEAKAAEVEQIALDTLAKVKGCLITREASGNRSEKALFNEMVRKVNGAINRAIQAIETYVGKPEEESAQVSEAN